MGKPIGSVGFVSASLAHFDAEEVASELLDALPCFDDSRDVLDADDWDDMETAAWLAQPSWGSIRGDDPECPWRT